MAMVGPPSDCFEDLKDDLARQTLPAAFLPEPEAARLHGDLRRRLERGQAYCWKSLDRHGLKAEAALAEVAAWPGSTVCVLLLDLVSERRALRIERSWLRNFVDEYLDPIAETYFVSEDRRRIVCLDHHETGHAAVLE